MEVKESSLRADNAASNALEAKCRDVPPSVKERKVIGQGSVCSAVHLCLCQETERGPHELTWGCCGSAPLENVVGEGKDDRDVSVSNTGQVRGWLRSSVLRRIWLRWDIIKELYVWGYNSAQDL